jgi:hypothetical protein
VSRIGPYSGILGPYAVDGTSSYAVNNVTKLWGMQVADVKIGQIVTANIPNHPLDYCMELVGLLTRVKCGKVALRVIRTSISGIC